MIEYRQVAGPALAALGERLAAPVRAIPTPFPELNALCMGMGGQRGLAYGWHVLAAGRSGLGKTFLAANLAAQALRDGESVAFHSLEMSWDELAVRMLAIVSGEPHWRLSPGQTLQPRSLPSGTAGDGRRTRRTADQQRTSLQAR
jgi:replicative DNA helicase